MYTQVATSMAVTTTPSYTDPVSMEGANAAILDVVLIENSGAGECHVKLQGSNDLESWTAVGDAGDVIEEADPGHYTSLDSGNAAPLHDVGFAFVRAHCVMVSGTAVCSVGVATYQA